MTENEIAFEKMQELLKETDQLDQTYSEQYRTDLATKTLTELVASYEVRIGKYRKQYSDEKNYKLKADYFNTTLKQKELGYKLAKAEAEKALQGFTVKPHRDWVTEYDLRIIKEYGYDVHFTNKTIFLETLNT
jgi:hypothetical protein